MERLTKDERERALWVVIDIAVLRGKGGYSEQEIAEKAGFNSVELALGVHWQTTLTVL
jgi:hypothetical protein